MITTQGFRLSNLPRYTPVDPSLVAFNPSAATSGIMDALRVGATLEKIKADRAAAEELAATREARIAYENATKGAATRVAPRKADLELATIGFEEGALGKRYKAEDMDLLNKIAAGERLFQRQPILGRIEDLTAKDTERKLLQAEDRDAVGLRKMIAEINLMESEIQKNLATAAATGAKEPKLTPDQEAYLKAMGELAASAGIPVDQFRQLVASGATDDRGIPYAAAIHSWNKGFGQAVPMTEMNPFPRLPAGAAQPIVSADGTAAPVATPTAPAGRAVFQLDKSGNVKRVDKPATAPAAAPVVVPAQEKPAGSIAKPEGEKTTSTARPQTAQEAAHGDLGNLSPVNKQKSDESLVDLQSLATLSLPALTQLKGKVQSPDLLRTAAKLKTAGRGIAAGARGLMTPAGLGALASRAAGTATLAPLIAEGYDKVGGALASKYFGTDKMTLLDAQAAGVAAPTTQEAVSQEQFDRITRTISDIVAKIEQIRGLEGVDEMTKAEAVAELTRQGQALAARRNSLLSSI